MTPNYNELVGILVTFSKPIRSYRVDYCYREKNDKAWGAFLVQYGMDWVLLTQPKIVKQGLEDAYASAIHCIWQNEQRTHSQTYLQLVAGQNPRLLELSGSWALTAER